MAREQTWGSRSGNGVSNVLHCQRGRSKIKEETTKDTAQCPQSPHRVPWTKPTRGYDGQFWAEGDGPAPPFASRLLIAKPPSNFAGFYTRLAVFKGAGDLCSAEINTLFNLESILNSFFSSLHFTPQWKQLCHYKWDCFDIYLSSEKCHFSILLKTTGNN